MEILQGNTQLHEMHAVSFSQIHKACMLENFIMPRKLLHHVLKASRVKRTNTSIKLLDSPRLYRAGETGRARPIFLAYLIVNHFTITTPPNYVDGEIIVMNINEISQSMFFASVGPALPPPVV